MIKLGDVFRAFQRHLPQRSTLITLADEVMNVAKRHDSSAAMGSVMHLLARHLLCNSRHMIFLHSNLRVGILPVSAVASSSGRKDKKYVVGESR